MDSLLPIFILHLFLLALSCSSDGGFLHHGKNQHLSQEDSGEVEGLSPRCKTGVIKFSSPT